MNGIHDAAAGVEREGADVLVNVREGLVEILGACGRGKKRKRINTEDTESAEGTEKRGLKGHGFG
jgi:hypothetical protein